MNAAILILALTLSKFCMGCSFQNGNLAGADLSNAVYLGTNFQGANLRGTSFRNAQLVAANFENADLRGAAFDRANCIACNFLGARLDGATFERVRMLAANFESFAAEVNDAQLRSLLAGCVTCNFSKSDLHGRDLSLLPLISVDFSKADLRGSRLTGAALCWYQVSGAGRATVCDKLGGAQLEGANLSSVQACDDPLQRLGCTPVSAAQLRQSTGSDLAGAVLVP